MSLKIFSAVFCEKCMNCFSTGSGKCFHFSSFQDTLHKWVQFLSNSFWPRFLYLTCWTIIYLCFEVISTLTFLLIIFWAVQWCSLWSHYFTAAETQVQSWTGVLFMWSLHDFPVTLWASSGLSDILTQVGWLIICSKWTIVCMWVMESCSANGWN